MESIAIQGLVDDQHRLSAVVPGSIPPGPVTIWIATESEEDDAGAAWVTGISHQWADELADPRQDIYSLADGDPVDPA
jgi:ectoine hydroxylase-related dioxygenase (phytanoyl-CoA dioxygenase family)